MSLSKLTKVELVALIQDRDAEIEKLRLALAQATPIAPKRTSATRYWDEFPSRKDALAWAKETRGALKQRPAQAGAGHAGAGQ